MEPKYISRIIIQNELIQDNEEFVKQASEDTEENSKDKEN